MTFQAFISASLAYYFGLTIVYLTPFCCEHFDEKHLTFVMDYESFPWANFISINRFRLQISCEIIMLLFYISIIITMKIVRN